MDQEKLILLIIAAELNTSNRLQILEQSECAKSESHINTLLEFSKVESSITTLLDKLLGGVIDKHE